MSRQLWRPSTDSDGIPFETLCTFVSALSDWREQYLNLVGVPNNFEGEWDFVSVSDFKNSYHTAHHRFVGRDILRQRRNLSRYVDHPVQCDG
jgi:hypothetical protein